MRRFHGVQVGDLWGNTQIEQDCGASVPGCFSPVLLFVTPWTRHEYWSGWPFLSLGILLTQGSNLGLLHCRQSLDYLLSHQGLQYWSAKWWGDEDARIAGGEGRKDAGQFIHSPQPLCYTSSLPPFLPSLSSFIWLWESFLSSVEVLAFVAGSFLSGKFL